MFRLNNPLGRLVTIRLIAPVAEEQFDLFDAKARHLVVLLPPNLVFCSDLRSAGRLPAAVVVRVPVSMRRDQPWLRRAALLVQQDSAMAAPQFRRFLKEASSTPKRRTFYDAEDALAWRSEVLLPSEQKYLESVLPGPIEC